MAIISTTNSWRSIDPCPAGGCAYSYDQGSDWDTVINSYGGGVYNPFWGERGGLIFHGGGHAATNNNAVAILDFNDLTYKLVSNPSINATGINPASGPSFPGFDRTYGEHVSDRKPGSAHTYDCLEILPPAGGGAPNGSLVRPLSTAVHTSVSANIYWAHKLDMNTRDVGTVSTRDGNTWSRYSVNAGRPMIDAGGCSAYDNTRNRIWWFGTPSNNRGFICYLDCTTRRQESFDYGNREALFDVDTPIMRYIPAIDSLVVIGPYNGSLQLFLMRCCNPTAGFVRLSTSISIPANSRATPWDYVPELGKIILHSNADTSAMYEITVPTNGATTWATARQPLQGVTTMTSAYGVGKRFSWASNLGCIVYKPLAAAPAFNQFYAYRPVGI